MKNFSDIEVDERCPVGAVVSTSAFHVGDESSILSRGTKINMKNTLSLSSLIYSLLHSERNRY